MKLSSVMLGSENPGLLASFYTKIFGEPGWQQGEWYGYDLGGCGLMIGPHSEVKGSNREPGRIMINLEVKDVKAEFERIKALDVDVVAEPYQPEKENNPDTWLATFADIDNNYLQLASPWEE